MKSKDPVDVEVGLKLPKSAVDFIDFLCSLNGRTRECWLRRTLQVDLRAFLDDPGSEWSEDWIKERFGLEPFLPEDSTRSLITRRLAPEPL